VTAQKLTICPYCGESLSKKPKSLDHIIPRQMGGAYSFKIVSCQSCNAEISRIEQNAMNTIQIRNLLAEIGESGIKIKTRRKRDFIPLQKEVGMSCQAPIKMYYNNKTHRKELVFLSPPKREFKEGETYQMFIPVSATEDTEEDMISLAVLANKIVMGTCVWLWGDNFSRTKQAADLRKRIRKVNPDEILEMESSEKHLVLSKDTEKDALDNRPHHSILIGRLGNLVVGLINIFGSYESMTVVGKYDDNFRDWIGESGVIVISKTTVNEVLRMTWQEYESFKSDTKKLSPS
jgi:hypothetical protein